jgi:hypothetical protein
MTARTGSPADTGQHPVARMLAETTVVLVLLTLGYALVPFRLDRGTGFLLRVALSVLALVGLVFVIRAHVRRSRRVLSKSYLRVEYLIGAFYLIVLGFALLYAVTAQISPAQFVGVDGRVSALYLSTTVVSTVGMGDVHPSEPAARIMCIVQMLFDTVYLGAGLRVLTMRTAEKEDA